MANGMSCSMEYEKILHDTSFLCSCGRSGLILVPFKSTKMSLLCRYAIFMRLKYVKLKCGHVGFLTVF